jgi:hypothetical protein
VHPHRIINRTLEDPLEIIPLIPISFNSISYGLRARLRSQEEEEEGEASKEEFKIREIRSSSS